MYSTSNEFDWRSVIVPIVAVIIIVGLAVACGLPYLQYDKKVQVYMETVKRQAPELVSAIPSIYISTYKGATIDTTQHVFHAILPSGDIEKRYSSHILPIYALGAPFTDKYNYKFWVFFAPDLEKLTANTPEITVYDSSGQEIGTGYEITLPASNIIKINSRHDVMMYLLGHQQYNVCGVLYYNDVKQCESLAKYLPPAVPPSSLTALIPEDMESVYACFPGGRLDANGVFDRKELDACVSQIIGVEGHLIIYPLAISENKLCYKEN